MTKRILIGATFLVALTILTGCPLRVGLTIHGQDPNLVGTWVGTISVPGNPANDVTLVFTATQFDLVETINNNDPNVLQGLHGVDTSANPDSIDLYVREASSGVLELKDENLKGVYEISVVDQGNGPQTQLRMTFVNSSELERPLGIDGGPNLIVAIRQ